MYAVGAIASGSRRQRARLTARSVRTSPPEYIREARDDDSIKAAVLRVDSPGGSPVAFDVIWRALMLLRDEQAARGVDVGSGGFGRLLRRHAGPRHRRAARHTDRLHRHLLRQVRHRRHVQQARGQRRGISEGSTPRCIRRRAPVHARGTGQGRRADAGLLRPVHREGRRGALLDAGEDRRHRPGPVWTGRQARERGLVDELGGLPRALSIAQQRAGIRQDTAVQVVVYPPKPTVFEALSSFFGGAQDVRASRPTLPGQRIGRCWLPFDARCRCCGEANRSRCCPGCSRDRVGTVDLKVDGYGPTVHNSNEKGGKP